MSSASVPNPAGSAAPVREAPGPAIVPSKPKSPRKLGLWLGAAILLLAAAGALYLNRRAETARRTEKRAVTTIRTGGIAAGALRQTVRVSGVIAAERFAALLAPQLRGSRSDRSRSSYSGGVSTKVSTTASSQGYTISQDNSSSSSSATAFTGVSSGGGSTTSSLGVKRGTSNRFSDSARSTSSRTSLSANTSGDMGRGSQGSALFSSSGGSHSHGSDFDMILLDCAKPGSMVKKGDVVAEFDRQNMLLRLDDYKASLTAYEASINKLKADLAVAMESHQQLLRAAKADYDKTVWDLKTIEVRSAIEAEKFRLAVEEAGARYKEVEGETKLLEESQRAQLRAVEIDRDQAKIELQRAQNNIDRMLMKAPIDGLVVMQTIYRGGDYGQVQPGDQLHHGMNFMSIVDPSSMVINAEINQVDGELIRIGQKAKLHIDAYPDLELPATVVAVGAMTVSSGWRANYVKEIPVRLKLDKMDPRVIPDLSGSADIVLASEENAAIAPLGAVFHDSSQNRPFVFLQTPSGWQRREVDLGLANHVAVAVKSGLRKGDVVALERVVQEKK